MKEKQIFFVRCRRKYVLNNTINEFQYSIFESIILFLLHCLSIIYIKIIKFVMRMQWSKMMDQEDVLYVLVNLVLLVLVNKCFSLFQLYTCPQKTFFFRICRKVIFSKTVFEFKIKTKKHFL